MDDFYRSDSGRYRESVMLRRYNKLGYPLNLWSVVLDRKVSFDALPEDWAASLAYVLRMLNPQQAELLQRYFEQGLSLDALGQIFGIAKASVRARMERVILTLRRPLYIKIFQLGVTKAAVLLPDEVNAAAPGCCPVYKITLSSPVSELNLGMRVYYCLKRARLDTVGDVVGLSRKELLDIHGFGVRCLDELESQLSKHGFSLKQSV